MAYSDDYVLATSQQFINRLSVAFAKQAGTVSTEVTSTTNHANRALLSKVVLAAPLVQAESYALAIVANMGLTGDGVTTPSDAQILAAVSGAWNAMANALAGV